MTNRGTRKVVGYAPKGEEQTVLAVVDGDLQVRRRVTHYRAEHVEEADEPAPVDPDAALLAQLEGDCRRWFYILRRCPLPGEYIALKRSGQAARWFDVAYEKGVDQAPIKVTKTARGVEIEHEAPKGRRAGVSAEEMSWMDRMMDAMLTLRFGSIDWVLVTGRAQRRPWADLTRLDVERRRERQLRNLYRAALHKLLPVWLARVHKM